MTECDLETTVPEWMIEHPETFAVFRDANIDCSCGGKSLRYACEQQGLDADAVLDQLRRMIEANRDSDQR